MTSDEEEDSPPSVGKKLLPDDLVNSFRSPQVILDSDNSEDDDPKDLHRDVTDDESEDDVPLLKLKTGNRILSSEEEDSEVSDDEQEREAIATVPKVNVPSRSVGRVRGRHDDSVDSPFFR